MTAQPTPPTPSGTDSPGFGGLTSTDQLADLVQSDHRYWEQLEENQAASEDPPW